MRRGSQFGDNRRAAKLVNDYGFLLFPSFVLGFPGETEKTVQQTGEFALSLRDMYLVDRVDAFIMTPLPGSRAYQMLLEAPEMAAKYRERDRLSIKELQQDWNRQFCHVAYDEIEAASRRISYGPD